MNWGLCLAQFGFCKMGSCLLLMQCLCPTIVGKIGCWVISGYTGYVDGKASDVRFNHPKGVTMDDKGNIYVADTSNLAIRKIGEAGMGRVRMHSFLLILM